MNRRDMGMAIVLHLIELTEEGHTITFGPNDTIAFDKKVRHRSGINDLARIEDILRIIQDLKDE
jgi:hypothetical protein